MRFVVWFVRIVVAVVVLLGAALAVVFALSNARINKTYVIPESNLVVSSDADAVMRGEHIAVIRGCLDCHGSSAEGKVFIDAAPMFARIVAPNLTAGEGGIARSYSDEDWVRAIRHGVRQNGKSLYFMPAEEFAVMSEQDLSDLIAYLKQLEPADSDLPTNLIGPIARGLLLAGQFPLLPAEVVDHEASIPTATPSGVTLAHGEYLAVTCTGCHGQMLSGGPLPGSSEGDPVPTNLTPHETGLAAWSEADFVKAMREGLRPDGSDLDAFMPWQGITSKMKDDELAALWLYLQNIDAVAAGNR